VLSVLSEPRGAVRDFYGEDELRRPSIIGGRATRRPKSRGPRPGAGIRLMTSAAASAGACRPAHLAPRVSRSPVSTRLYRQVLPATGARPDGRGSRGACSFHRFEICTMCGGVSRPVGGPRRSPFVSDAVSPLRDFVPPIWSTAIGTGDRPVPASIQPGPPWFWCLSGRRGSGPDQCDDVCRGRYGFFVALYRPAGTGLWGSTRRGGGGPRRCFYRGKVRARRTAWCCWRHKRGGPNPGRPSGPWHKKNKRIKKKSLARPGSFVRR